MATDDENYPSDDAGTGQSLAITLEKGVALEFKPTGSGRQRYPIVARKKAIPALEAETVL